MCSLLGVAGFSCLTHVQLEIDWSSPVYYLREETTAAVTSMELSHFGGSPAVEMMDFVFHPFTQNDLLF